MFCTYCDCRSTGASILTVEGDPPCRVANHILIMKKFNKNLVFYILDVHNIHIGITFCLFPVSRKA